MSESVDTPEMIWEEIAALSNRGARCGMAIVAAASYPIGLNDEGQEHLYKGGAMACLGLSSQLYRGMSKAMEIEFPHE